MGSVGDFTPDETTDVLADPDTFLFFGEEFDIPATVSVFALIRFGWLVKASRGQATRGEQAKRRAKTDSDRVTAYRELADSDLTAQAAIYELLKACLGDDQLERFGSIADANGVDLPGLIGVTDQIQEAIAGRPTRRSADSSDGPSTTGTPSTADGSGPTEPEMTPRERQALEIEAASIPVGSPA